MNEKTKRAYGIDAAYAFYRKHIHKVELINLLEEHNLKVPGLVPSVLWELFAAILTGQKGTGNTGADLQGWEVKSATMDSSFEYQYHLNTGLEKLEEDCTVNHLFCSYSKDYSRVSVMVMKGEDLAESHFHQWKDGYDKNYDRNVDSSNRRQRYRKSISYGHVRNNGEPILTIEDGQLILKRVATLEKYTAN
ncbi:hypothetical protein [Vibrio parahaemolyticus]|uniref:hypothetical protein n=1 Tax=Vibrio parahaemolyticus TaxID=670 RepID=UPI001124167F|nr:hypothetical protein [Vibrio parahaemolyticus]TOE63746.1 hypothetical protein CGJ39_14140 [Vibrio parahaemolyticus]